MKKTEKTAALAQSGVIAALYVGVTLLLQPIGFGSVQCRVSEALTVLPVYTSTAMPGLIVGCFLSNLVGLSSGINPAGAWDLLLGTVATGLSAFLTYRLRKVRVKGLPLVATLPPVVINAVAVGAELYAVYGGLPLLVHMALVGVGQLLSCVGGGLALAAALEKSGMAQRLL